MPSERSPRFALALAFAANPRFAAALALCIVGTAFGSHLIGVLLGPAGLIAIISGLVALSTLVLISRWGTFEWRWLLPISLLAFVGWSTLSVFWSSYQWVSLGGVAVQLAVAYLAVFVAVARDVIQIVRAFGDVLRVVIGLSLALEVFAGILIDTPIDFLGIRGDLGEGGPIQGIMGSRNQLSLIALLALVTFVTELLTRSVQQGTAVGSIAAASLTLVFTQSPIGFGVLVALGVAGVALLVLRRLSPESRTRAQFGLVGAVAVTLVLVYAFRSRIIGLLDASNELDYRLGVWRQLLDLLQVHPLEGWGWTGPWRTDILPYSAVETGGGAQYLSAHNSYLDVWFQLGMIGFIIFLVLLALTFGRSWILASRQRSRVFVWPALVLVVLLTTSLAESSVLMAYGGLTVVICVVKAAEKLSWRRSLPE